MNWSTKKVDFNGRLSCPSEGYFGSGIVESVIGVIPAGFCLFPHSFANGTVSSFRPTWPNVLPSANANPTIPTLIADVLSKHQGESLSTTISKSPLQHRSAVIVGSLFLGCVIMPLESRQNKLTRFYLRFLHSAHANMPPSRNARKLCNAHMVVQDVVTV